MPGVAGPSRSWADGEFVKYSPCGVLGSPGLDRSTALSRVHIHDPGLDSLHGSHGKAHGHDLLGDLLVHGRGSYPASWCAWG